MVTILFACLVFGLLISGYLFYKKQEATFLITSLVIIGCLLLGGLWRFFENDSLIFDLYQTTIKVATDGSYQLSGRASKGVKLYFNDQEIDIPRDEEDDNLYFTIPLKMTTPIKSATLVAKKGQTELANLTILFDLLDYQESPRLMTPASKNKIYGELETTTVTKISDGLYEEKQQANRYLVDTNHIIYQVMLTLEDNLDFSAEELWLELIAPYVETDVEIVETQDQIAILYSSQINKRYLVSYYADSLDGIQLIISQD